MENHTDPDVEMSSSVTSPTSATAKKKMPFREVLPKKGLYISFYPWIDCVNLFVDNYLGNN